ncbi:MAG: threonine synthase [Saprospiraceae bacterium]
MQYYSLNNRDHKVGFEQALVAGLAPDGGLYFPESILPLPTSFFEQLDQLSYPEMAYQAIQTFVGDEIPEKHLRQILQETLDFEFPLVPITEQIYALELFHGPTLAFKDVGARFMSRCLGYFNKNKTQEVTVLVATSGDTGSAVAHGFYKVPGVKVVILYPSGKVSDIQEKQLTTLGENITALEVEGVFDDCQAWVKKAFNDATLKEVSLTSANSINIARWMPQMFYYFFLYAALKKHKKPIVVSCPSGNFGNVCAGILAQKLGLPIHHFIIAQNANNTIERYLKTGHYEPLPTIPTLANAMDVSNPSNWVRIKELYQHDEALLRQNLSTFSFSDAENVAILQKMYAKYQYIADPHGALGFEALDQYLKNHPGHIGVFLETAHPIKFVDTIERALNITLALPSGIETLLHQEKKAIRISNYEGLKDLLLGKVKLCA